MNNRDMKTTTCKLRYPILRLSFCKKLHNNQPYIENQKSPLGFFDEFVIFEKILILIQIMGYHISIHEIR